VEYGDHMTRMMRAIDPLLDTAPLHVAAWIGPRKSLRRAWKNRAALKSLLSAGENKLVGCSLPFAVHSCLIFSELFDWLTDFRSRRKPSCGSHDK